MPALKNPKHEKFAQLVAKGVSLGEAFTKAGFAPSLKNAARLKKTEGVSARIDEILSRAAEKAETSIAKTLDEIARLAFADVGQAVEWDGFAVRLKPSSELPPEVRAAISEVRQTKDGIAIKFHSKTAALEMLGKHFGLFKERVEVTGADGGAIQVDSLSEVEIARRLAFVLAQGRQKLLEEPKG